MNELSIAAISRSSEVEVLEAKETWSEYQLADGTLLRVKPIMISVTRLEDAETTTGEPIYTMKSTLITDVRGAQGSPGLG